VAAMVKKEMST